jgi:hypothetical protein
MKLANKVPLAVGAGALLSTVTGVSAAGADSPVITVSNNQCAAQWLSGPNQFGIEDRDVNDNDYCYVRYGWSSGDTNTVGRYNNPEDVKGWNYYNVNVTGHSTIWWKVCKERENDPDICTGYRSDAT